MSMYLSCLYICRRVSLYACMHLISTKALELAFLLLLLPFEERPSTAPCQGSRRAPLAISTAAAEFFCGCTHCTILLPPANSYHPLLSTVFRNQSPSRLRRRWWRRRWVMYYNTGFVSMSLIQGRFWRNEDRYWSARIWLHHSRWGALYIVIGISVVSVLSLG